MADVNWEREMEVATEVARASALLAIELRAKGIVAENKSDLSPVTLADKECERLIGGILAREFPDDGQLGEEGAARPSRSGRRWIIDPIDGTRDFIRGNSQWAVLLGLEENAPSGEVVAGVCYLPGYGEIYSASKSGGAWCNGNRLRASSITEASQAVACLNGLNSLYGGRLEGRSLEWLSRFWAVRSFGGAPDAMLIASGKVDVWIEPKAAPWDLAPLKIILEESGARFLNFDGGSSIYGGNCAACAPALEAEVWTLLGAPGAAASS